VKDDALLSIRDLAVHFRTSAGLVRAVDGVSYDVRRGETLAVVGESGCGKSVTALAILGLVACPPGEIAGGSIELDGEDLLHASEARLREIRGNEVAMIFQEPMTSLNPVFTVGDQVGEALALHLGLSEEECREETARLFALVGIPSPEARLDEYPHQLSGGMRQRVMIAMALACSPKLLVADEPTTALDVTVQAQILELLGRLQRDLGMSVILITHDLGVVAETADRALVMYAGEIVESSRTGDLFRRPAHPYTQGLLASRPDADGRLRALPGTVPEAGRRPGGCAFEPRCASAFSRCRAARPTLKAVEGSASEAACFLHDGRPDT